jgi:hypothetical protein
LITDCYTLFTWNNGYFGTDYLGGIFNKTSNSNIYCYSFPSSGVSVSGTESNAGFVLKKGSTFIHATASDNNATNTFVEGSTSDSYNNNFFLSAGTFYKIYYNTSTAQVLASTIPTTGLDISSNASASVSGRTVSFSCNTDAVTGSGKNGQVTGWTIKESGTEVATSATATLPTLSNVTGGSHTYTVIMSYKDAAGVETFTSSEASINVIVAYPNNLQSAVDETIYPVAATRAVKHNGSAKKL